jgi:hypothetical protein
VNVNLNFTAVDMPSVPSLLALSMLSDSNKRTLRETSSLRMNGFLNRTMEAGMDKAQSGNKKAACIPNRWIVKRCRWSEMKGDILTEQLQRL